MGFNSGFKGLKQTFVCLSITLAKNSHVPIIIQICIRLLVNCHTLIACQFLVTPASSQRLFVLGCRIFTPHRFVVICVVFGQQQYDVLWPSLSNCVLITFSLALFCLIADYGPCLFPVDITSNCWSQWPCGLRLRSAAACLLRSWVRIPSGAWMFVCCECCVLSGRGLCDELITHPEESYRLCCVVCDIQTSRMRRP